MKEYEGKCLCGAVEFTVQADEPKAGICHCDMCRTWAAGPLVMLHGSHAPKVKDESQLAVYSSSEWGERCFCKTCGSSLFWRSKDGSFYGTSVNALNEDKDFKLESEIFVDRKPAYYDDKANTKQLTEQQFWQMVEQMQQSEGA